MASPATPEFRTATKSLTVAGTHDTKQIAQALATPSGQGAHLFKALHNDRQDIDSLRKGLLDTHTYLDSLLAYLNSQLTILLARPTSTVQYVLLEDPSPDPAVLITLPAPVVAGDRHTVFVRQDSTGGWIASFGDPGSGVNWVPDLGDTSPDLCYLFDFVALINEDNNGALEWFITTETPPKARELPVPPP